MAVGMAGQFNPSKIPFIPGVTASMPQGDSTGLWTGMPNFGGSVFGGFGFNPMIGSGMGTYNTNPQRIQSYEDYQRVRATNLAVNKSAERLAKSILNNESSRIVDRYKKFRAAVSQEDGYKCLESKEEQDAYIQNRFQQITGQDIEDMIDENAHSSFWSGVLNAVTFGLAGDKSRDTLKKETIEEDKPVGSTLVNGLGRVGGGLATGAATGAGVGAIFGGIGAVPGAIIGGIVGGISGLVSWIWS